MPAESPSLDALRREIDEIDDSIHDLLMRRADLAEAVRDAKGGGAAPRPGREATVLRRLLARHRGAFPPSSLAAIWREIFAALTALQGPYAVAVQAIEGGGLHALARAQFGAFTTLTDYQRAGQIVAAVREGAAALGVLPPPADDEAGRWWRYLVTDRDDRARIVARLPFVPGLGRDAGAAADALVIARIDAENTGHDRSYLVFQSQEQISRGRLQTALAEHKFQQRYYDCWRDEQAPASWLQLVEVEGFVDAADARIKKLAETFEPTIDKVYALGAYALPLDLAPPAPAPAPTKGRRT